MAVELYEIICLRLLSVTCQLVGRSTFAPLDEVDVFLGVLVVTLALTSGGNCCID